MKHLAPNSRRAGRKLLEALASPVVRTMLLGALGAVTLSGKGSYGEDMGAANLEAKGRRILERLAEEIKGARETALSPDQTPPTGASRLLFQTSAGYAACAQLGSTSAIAFEHDPNDADDGLKDEGRIVLVRDVGLASEKRVVIVDAVTELREGETVDGDEDDGNGLRDEGALLRAGRQRNAHHPDDARDSGHAEPTRAAHDRIVGHAAQLKQHRLGGQR